MSNLTSRGTNTTVADDDNCILNGYANTNVNDTDRIPHAPLPSEEVPYLSEESGDLSTVMQPELLCELMKNLRQSSIPIHEEKSISLPQGSSRTTYSRSDMTTGPMSRNIKQHNQNASAVP